MQTFDEAHGVPLAKNRHPGSQQPPGRFVPLSHCSPGSTTPLPQVGGDRQPFTGEENEWHIGPTPFPNVPLNVRPSGATVPVSVVGPVLDGGLQGALSE